MAGMSQTAAGVPAVRGARGCFLPSIALGQLKREHPLSSAWHEKPTLRSRCHADWTAGRNRSIVGDVNANPKPAGNGRINAVMRFFIFRHAAQPRLFLRFQSSSNKL